MPLQIALQQIALRGLFFFLVRELLLDIAKFSQLEMIAFCSPSFKTSRTDLISDFISEVKQLNIRWREILFLFLWAIYSCLLPVFLLNYWTSVSRSSLRSWALFLRYEQQLSFPVCHCPLTYVVLATKNFFIYVVDLAKAFVLCLLNF